MANHIDERSAKYLNLSGYIPRSLLRKPAECDDLYTSQLAAGLLFCSALFASQFE
jgi:hypothetical protein